MKKISLKNILRKTFKKSNSKKSIRKVKSVKKIKATKKIKVAKVRKTNKKIVKKKITISPKTATGINLKNKTDNLMRRLSGLLYLDNKTMGDIKEKIKKNSTQ